MLSTSIKFKNFKNNKRINKRIKQNLKTFFLSENQIKKSLTKNYKDKYNIKFLKKFVGDNDIKLIGMGGSILGAQAIYNFLNHKVIKKFLFIDNLKSKQKRDNQKNVNLIISKSGNTLETIVNTNLHIKKKK